MIKTILSDVNLSGNKHSYIYRKGKEYTVLSHENAKNEYKLKFQEVINLINQNFNELHDEATVTLVKFKIEQMKRSYEGHNLLSRIISYILNGFKSNVDLANGLIEKLKRKSQEFQLLNPKQPIVITAQLQGGLGNQLFQAAAAYSHALDVRGIALFPRVKLDHVKESPVLENLTRFESEEQIPEFQQLEEHDFHFLDIPKTDQSLYLKGFFQTAKYFHHHRAEILKLFAPSEEIRSALELKHQDFLKKETVAVHIRRGNYLTFKGSNGGTIMYKLSEDDYYQKSLDHFTDEKYHFVIFADDMEFAKKMPALKKLKNVTFIEGQKAHEDFYLMTLCKHHITANSTFSWWGAYLAQNPEQKVIFPLRWFGSGIKSNLPANPNAHYAPPPYLPMDHWIKID